jgi:thiosulfate/3-mercaptopyruvate sulfurtransferase
VTERPEPLLEDIMMQTKPGRMAILFLGAALGLAPYLASGGQAQGEIEKFVSGDWLAANLKNPDVRIIDTRMDIRDYWLSHIPGALYVDTGLLRWPDHGVPGKLISVEALALLLGQMGIGEGTTVVAYYDKNGYPPYYLLWALEYIGHKSFALLEDGFERWRTEGRPMTQDYPNIKPVAYRLPAKRATEIRATIEDVLKETRSGAVLLDVRPEDLYKGEKGAWKRKGHIKGALSHPWASDLANDGIWKPKEELLAAYQRLGVTPDKKIIVYCGQGQMAAFAYFSLKYRLGFPSVRLYDGGFSEWSVREDLPVEGPK